MGLRDINYLHKTEGTSLAVQWLGLCTFTVGVVGSIPGSRRSLGGGNGNPLRYSCLEKNPMDRGAWGPWGSQRVTTE